MEVGLQNLARSLRSTLLTSTFFAANVIAAGGGNSAPGVSLAPEPGVTLFSNVNVFNGTEDKLHENMNVLVEGRSMDAKTITENFVPAIVRHSRSYLSI